LFWQITAPVYHNMAPNPPAILTEIVPRFCVDSETNFTTPLVSSAALPGTGKTSREKSLDGPHHRVSRTPTPGVRRQGLDVLLVRYVTKFDQYRRNVGRSEHPKAGRFHGLAVQLGDNAHLAGESPRKLHRICLRLAPREIEQYIGYVIGFA